MEEEESAPIRGGIVLAVLAGAAIWAVLAYMVL